MEFLIKKFAIASENDLLEKLAFDCLVIILKTHTILREHFFDVLNFKVFLSHDSILSARTSVLFLIFLPSLKLVRLLAHHIIWFI